MKRFRVVLVYWAVAIVFFMPGAAHAYIDPATTTYLIQIVTALAVTAGVSLSILMYRIHIVAAKIRFGLYGLLYRARAKAKGDGSAHGDGPSVPQAAQGGGPPAQQDATNGKARTAAPPFAWPDYADPGRTEPLTEEDMAALGEPADMERIRDRRQGAEALWELGYTGRLKAALPASLALPLSFALIGCLDLAMQNAADMPFRPGAVVPALLLVSGVCFAALLFVIPAFRGRFFAAALSVALSVLVAGYIQGNYMNGALGELTGDAIRWSLFRTQAIGSVLVWASVFACVFLLLRFAKGAWRGVAIFAPLVLLVVQGVAFAAVLDGYRQGGDVPFWEQSEETLVVEGLHSPASEKNVVVFILDRLDEDFVDQIESGQPGFFEALDGFTKFDDNISYNGSTFPSMAGMLTGVRYMYDQPRKSYLDGAWADAALMRELKAHGVDIRIYEPKGDVYDNVGSIKGIASNISKGRLGFNKRIALVKLMKLSAFRYAPMPAKRFFWISPTEFGDTLEMTDDRAPYMINDFGFYENIVTYGLSPSGSEMGFFFFHLLGAHGPLNMDENINWVEEEEAADYTPQRVRQATGCFRIVFEYLGQMKALGLYEEATVIITGDHGDYVGDILDRPMLTALFVKPSGSAGTPLAYSHAPVCPDQLPGTVMEGFFGDTGTFGPGYMDVDENAAAVREYDVNLCRYEIDGDGRDFSNWKDIGKFPGGWK